MARLFHVTEHDGKYTINQEDSYFMVYSIQRIKFINNHEILVAYKKGFLQIVNLSAFEYRDKLIDIGSYIVDIHIMQNLSFDRWFFSCPAGNRSQKQVVIQTVLGAVLLMDDSDIAKAIE